MRVPGPLGPLVSWSTEAVTDGNEVLTMVPFLEGKDGNTPLNKALLAHTGCQIGQLAFCKKLQVAFPTRWFQGHSHDVAPASRYTCKAEYANPQRQEGQFGCFLI